MSMDSSIDELDLQIWKAVTSEPPAATPTILCVDDEPNVVSALARLFRRERCRVLTAGGAAEALAILEREPVNVVLSDMRMPEMDGAAFLEEVARRWPRTARILLTGYSDLESAVAAINRGRIIRYLFKPWDDDEVRITVRHALEQEAAEEERRQRHETARRRVARLAVSRDEMEDRLARDAEQLRGAELTRATLDASWDAWMRMFGTLAEAGIDPHRGHVRRVAEQARRTASALGLDAAGARNVCFAALLHDVGRLALPPELRAKPDAHLTPAERSLAQRHAVVGEAMLMGLEPLREVARLVRHHHERLDGGGYPDGLRGDDIPLGARIIAVASDFDDLRAGAATGLPLPAGEAERFVRERGGAWYDLACVDAYLAAAALGPEADAPAPRCLGPDALEAGMELAADVVAGHGAVLLTRGRALDDDLIAALRRFERETGWTLEVKVAGAGGRS